MYEYANALRAGAGQISAIAAVTPPRLEDARHRFQRWAFRLDQPCLGRDRHRRLIRSG
jgi:hypothetical protein